MKKDNSPPAHRAEIDEQDIREQICETGRRMYAKNFVAAYDGNISFRLGPGRLLCTPTGVSKGFMKPEEIALIDEAGRQVAGPIALTSEVKLHLKIFRELPDIRAVVHGHPPYATAFAAAGIAPPAGILPEVEVFLGQIPLAEYAMPSGKELAENLTPHLQAGATTILMSNHGAVACDKDLFAAYYRLEKLEAYCRILLLSRQLGGPKPLSPDRIKELKEKHG
jgi:L-fuculose-phosphate aldolase